MNTRDQILNIVSAVKDPEVPVLTIADLGIIRDVKVEEDRIEITITPTYSGCPAMDMIASDIRLALVENGFTNIKITSILSPAWTTDWMSSEGKRKLNKYGIAPPDRFREKNGTIDCPLCHSTDTRMLSQFGSTACKALYQCNHCKEPFDYFKCH